MERFDTRFINIGNEQEQRITSVLKEVFCSLKEKGYDPVNQVVGYLVSDDPTYITNYQNARAKLSHYTRDEILEELLKTFLEANHIQI